MRYPTLSPTPARPLGVVAAEHARGKVLPFPNMRGAGLEPALGCPKGILRAPLAAPPDAARRVFGWLVRALVERYPRSTPPGTANDSHPFTHPTP